MSTIPARTRSLRKPSDIGSKYGNSNAAAKSTPAEQSERIAAARPAVGEGKSNSPTSRLPTVRPTTARPTSLYGRPPSSSSIASKPSIRHPTANSIPSKAEPTLQRRPTTSKPAAPPTNPEPVKKDRSRPPITQIRHLRNSSVNSLSSSSNSSTRAPGHTRTKSSSTLLTSSTALRPPPSRDPTTREPSAEPPTTRALRSSSQPKKPSFSTLQQHFSPAKSLAPKPHPAAFLAPPSPSKLPSNIAISAETAKLQNELLQLHILHRDVGAVTQEWKGSAKQKLGARFGDVVRRNEGLVQEEVEETGRINAVALRRWKEESSPGWGLDEKVMVLDEVISGVWNLGGRDGKYARAVRKFERWLSGCQGILAARESDSEGLGNGEFVFLEALEHSWKDECTNLTRKLDTWRGQLRDLGELERGSSLATVVGEYRTLVKGMLAELAVMGEIERGVMEREGNWIKEMNEDEDKGEDAHTAGACWRAAR